MSTSSNIDKSSSKETDERIQVFIRIKPPLPLLLSSNSPKCLTVIEKDHKLILRKTKDTETTTELFRFNKIFNENSTQSEIYQTVANPIVNRILNGYNGTIFAYGQSGTGKTFTMLGDLEKLNLKGIIPNVFAQIFAEISLDNNPTSYIITMTFLEIYNEEIRDLLNDSQKKLDIGEKPDIGVYVKNLSGYTVQSMDNVIEIVSKGNKKRSKGITKLNDQSSRSHAILTTTIEAKAKSGSISFGKLNLVDLAGSERASKSFATGDRLREAGKINLSLSILGNVISALVDAKTNYVPYRNSKLTRLLQDSLGGNSLTSMIATVCPMVENFEETYYTLMYANRVKHVTNCVKKNDRNKSILKIFEEKITNLQRELTKLNEKELISVVKKPQSRQFPTANQNDELNNIEKQKKRLLEKIEIIQGKILIGGEHLMKRAQIQSELLRNSTKELHNLHNSQQMLNEIFTIKKNENEVIERKSMSLQEENQILDWQIENVESQISKAKRKLIRKENEYENEISSLLYTNECLTKHITLYDCILKQYFHEDDLKHIKRNMIWNHDFREWKIKFIHFCGNNVRKPFKRVNSVDNPVKWKEEAVYKKYSKWRK